MAEKVRDKTRLCNTHFYIRLDVALDIENHYVEEFPQLPTGPRELLKSYVDAGKLGIKTGEGFYRY